MRWLVIVIAAVAVAVGAACGGDSGGGASDEGLARGEFIDSKPITGSAEPFWDFPGDGSLQAIVADADAVAVAEILEVAEVVMPTHPAAEGWPVEVIEDGPWTTYRARVEQWVKGSGGQEVLIGQAGGIITETPLGQIPPGPYFYDGDFLLEPGRKYVLALDGRWPEMPGPCEFTGSAAGRGGFEVTDGYVHVLNHPITQDLRWLNGLTVQEFVGILEGYLASPP